MSEKEELVPESPVVLDSYPSPEFRGVEASSSKHHHGYTSLTPTPLLEYNAQIISQRLDGLQDSNDPESSELRASLVLRHSLQHAIQHGDTEVISWLAGLNGHWGDILDEEVMYMEDEEGWGIIGMGIQATCGKQQEKEESVRLLVQRWGIDAGPREGRDRTGWTPLHLASLLSTPPLISFLLTRGASPTAITNRGLTPLDLIAGMEDRSDTAILLEHATSTGTSASPRYANTQSRSGSISEPSLSERRQAMLQRRREHVIAKAKKAEQRDLEYQQSLEKERWITQMVAVIEADATLLFEQRKVRESSSFDSGLELWTDGDDEDVDSEDEDLDEVESGLEGTKHSPSYENMLFYGLNQKAAIFDNLITSYRPVCQPLSRRALPANALYRYARFAHYCCDETWLDDLLSEAAEKIEQSVYSNIDDVAHLAFWAYNTTLLLHMLRMDGPIGEICDGLGLLTVMEELINAVHVFIIRIAERKIDEILDEAFLEYETLEDFDDVRFEGEWTLFRNFTSKKQRSTILPSAASVFASPSTNNGDSATPTSLLGTLREKVESSSPFKTPQRPPIPQFGKDGTPRMDNTVPVHGAPVVSSDISPKRVTDILSAVLLVLQLYEVNPAITIQAFSQILYWIACELCNRILTRKKHLCRTKAVQIRMNITTLEDWVRSNGLPIRIVTKHFEPVTQLLQWLQCQSAISQFDDLIGTLQSMRALNPLQMRRAVKDYRYEVNEGRMTDECGQYLAQLQKDWEKRRIQMSVQTIQANAKRRSGSDDYDENDLDDQSIPEPGTPIDALFDGTTSLADFSPQCGPESMGELLDSRFMLPFQLPSDPHYLIAAAVVHHTFGQGHGQGVSRSSIPFGGVPMSRPASQSSFITRPMTWTIPDARKLRELPSDFFTWLKEREAFRRHRKELHKPATELVPAVRNPLGAATHDNIPVIPSIEIRNRSPNLSDPGIDGYQEDHENEQITPLKSHAIPFPSSGLQTSPSIDQLREKAQVPFELTSPQHRRADSYELSARSPPQRPSPMMINTSTSAGEFGGRSRQNTGGSTMMSASASSDGTKKKWWKLGRKQASGDSEDGENTNISPSWSKRSFRDTGDDNGGVALEEMRRTPRASTPGSVKGSPFWSR